MYQWIILQIQDVYSWRVNSQPFNAKSTLATVNKYLSVDTCQILNKLHHSVRVYHSKWRISCENQVFFYAEYKSYSKLKKYYRNSTALISLVKKHFQQISLWPHEHEKCRKNLTFLRIKNPTFIVLKPHNKFLLVFPWIN